MDNTNNNEEYSYLFKVLLVGKDKVGKSSIFQRFQNDFFTIHYISTIGVDFGVKTMQIGQELIKL